MKTRSLRSLVLLTGGVFLFGLVILLGTVIIQFKKLDQFSVYQSQQTQTMQLALDIKYHVVQIQQFLTDASLVHDEDPVKEARENLAETELTFVLSNFRK